MQYDDLLQQHHHRDLEGFNHHDSLKSDVLAPGGITVIQAEVQNNGNGPTFVHIDLIDSPSTWTCDA